MSLVKIKYIEGLKAILDGKAESINVALKDLSNVVPATGRTLLDVYSKIEVNNLLGGLSDKRTFNNQTDFQASIDWQPYSHAFVKDDGDGKWAMYMATSTVGTNMPWAVADFIKIGDQDSLQNAISAPAVLAALERNGVGADAIVGMKKSERDKLELLHILNIIDLDDMLARLVIAEGNISSQLTLINALTTVVNTLVANVATLLADVITINNTLVTHNADIAQSKQDIIDTDATLDLAVTKIAVDDVRITVLEGTIGSLITFISLTKAQLAARMTAGTLQADRTYVVTDAHPSLYSIGRNPAENGNKIYLKATSNNTIAKDGYGLFYNPKYASLSFYNNKTIIIKGVVTGNFEYGETVTGNNGYIGKSVGTIWSGMLENISGSTVGVTSLTGVTSGATVAIISTTEAVYNIGDKVIWGGVVWENTSGLVGLVVDVLKLSPADWQKIPYSTSEYNASMDEIEYDFTNNWIERRKNNSESNDVTYTYRDNILLSRTYHAIEVFQFGRSNADVRSNDVKNSYFECINFISSSVRGNILSNKSLIYDVHSENTFSRNSLTNTSSIFNIVSTSDFSGNSLDNNSIVYNMVASMNSSIVNCKLNNNDSISSSTIINDSRISNINMNSGNTINDCSFNDSGLERCELNYGSRIAEIKLVNKVIKNLTMMNSEIIVDLSTAVVIFEPQEKKIYTLPDNSTCRISYVNQFDVETTCDIID